MSVFYILIGASLFVALIFLIAFFWAVKSGQMDDTYTPSVRVLFDDDLSDKNKISNNKQDKLEKKA
ncbi:MAG: cbb3-type cytochrome oxidase assembly protein CcoS [Ignavibacteriaceae bacterium]|nr:cbb3-type cytochrome oxidase assembly protein CcoS [Ignavibacteriaceae bacterium]